MTSVTLKIRSRPPKSNNLLGPLKFNDVSVWSKSGCLVQKTECRQGCFIELYMYVPGDLKK